MHVSLLETPCKRLQAYRLEPTGPFGEIKLKWRTTNQVRHTPQPLSPAELLQVRSDTPLITLTCQTIAQLQMISTALSEAGLLTLQTIILLPRNQKQQIKRERPQLTGQFRLKKPVAQKMTEPPHHRFIAVQNGQLIRSQTLQRALDHPGKGTLFLRREGQHLQFPDAGLDLIYGALPPGLLPVNVSMSAAIHLKEQGRNASRTQAPRTKTPRSRPPQPPVTPIIPDLNSTLGTLPDHPWNASFGTSVPSQHRTQLTVNLHGQSLWHLAATLGLQGTPLTVEGATHG